MAEMSRYCKAYEAKHFNDYEDWQPEVANLRREKDDDGNELPARTELADDDILYLHDSYIVTDDVYNDESIIFDKVTDEWKAFCTEKLSFEIPVYEPIEIETETETAEDEATASEDAS